MTGVALFVEGARGRVVSSQEISGPPTAGAGAHTLPCRMTGVASFPEGAREGVTLSQEISGPPTAGAGAHTLPCGMTGVALFPEGAREGVAVSQKRSGGVGARASSPRAVRCDASDALADACVIVADVSVTTRVSPLEGAPCSTALEAVACFDPVHAGPGSVLSSYRDASVPPFSRGRIRAPARLLARRPAGSPR